MCVSGISLIHHMVASRTSPIESSIAINGVRANNKSLIHPWPYYIDCLLLSLKMVKYVYWYSHCFVYILTVNRVKLIRKVLKKLNFRKETKSRFNKIYIIFWLNFSIWYLMFYGRDRVFSIFFRILQYN